jgi:hypothetical protein
MATLAPIGEGHAEPDAADRLTSETAAEPHTTPDDVPTSLALIQLASGGDTCVPGQHCD